MSTEEINARYPDMDLWAPAEQVKALHADQLAAVAALQPVIRDIGNAVAQAAARLRQSGRLVYVGAGTSARIGVQDGVELLPTFNWPGGRVAFGVAGGEGALLRAVEGAEDAGEEGEARMRELGVGPEDVVIGIAASGNTPFTVSAVACAKQRGALTIGIANNAGSRLLAACDCPILIETGPELVAGSTRLKAGTAQKVALNLISTSLMMQLGRVYRGMMVDMKPTNAKLRRRARQIVVTLTGCSPEEADEALGRGGDIKMATLIVRGVDVAEARSLLARHDGNLRLALAERGLD